MSKTENTHKMTIRLSPLTEFRLERDYRLDGSRSKNEFIEKAITHYQDLLEVEQNETLPTAIQSAIDGRLGIFEDRISKKKYGYLPKRVKKTVDEIVDQMERLPVIDECYQVWWNLQSQIEDFYSEKERQRPPLSEQKEFRSIKNAVIQEAENIRMGTVTFEDTGVAEEIEADVLSVLPYDCWELWTVIQDDTAPMGDRDEAAAQLIDMAEGSDPDARYLVGKLYLDGPVLIPDSVEARYWLDLSARQGHVVAQYEFGRLLLCDDPEVCDPVLGIQWLECAASNGSDPAAYCLGKEYLRGEVVKKDSARAMAYLTQSAEAGNQYAQYALGKLYLCKQNQEQARFWFIQSAGQGNEHAQFFLDRWDSLRSPSVMLSVTRLLYHMGTVFREQAPAPSVPDGIWIDPKRLAQLREKKIAMGHKPDDHAEHLGPAMSM